MIISKILYTCAFSTAVFQFESNPPVYAKFLISKMFAFGIYKLRKCMRKEEYSWLFSELLLVCAQCYRPTKIKGHGGGPSIIYLFIYLFNEGIKQVQ